MFISPANEIRATIYVKIFLSNCIQKNEKIQLLKNIVDKSHKQFNYLMMGRIVFE